MGQFSAGDRPAVAYITTIGSVSFPYPIGTVSNLVVCIATDTLLAPVELPAPLGMSHTCVRGLTLFYKGTTPLEGVCPGNQEMIFFVSIAVGSATQIKLYGLCSGFDLRVFNRAGSQVTDLKVKSINYLSLTGVGITASITPGTMQLAFGVEASLELETGPTNSNACSAAADARCIRALLAASVTPPSPGGAGSTQFTVDLVTVGAWHEPLGLRNFVVVDPALSLTASVFPGPAAKLDKIAWSLSLLYRKSNSVAWPASTWQLSEWGAGCASAALAQLSTQCTTPSFNLPAASFITVTNKILYDPMPHADPLLMACGLPRLAFYLEATGLTSAGVLMMVLDALQSLADASLLDVSWPQPTFVPLFDLLFPLTFDLKAEFSLVDETVMQRAFKPGLMLDLGCNWAIFGFNFALKVKAEARPPLTFSAIAGLKSNPLAVLKDVGVDVDASVTLPFTVGFVTLTGQVRPNSFFLTVNTQFGLAGVAAAGFPRFGVTLTIRCGTAPYAIGGDQCIEDPSDRMPPLEFQLVGTASLGPFASIGLSGTVTSPTSFSLSGGRMWGAMLGFQACVGLTVTMQGGQVTVAANANATFGFLGKFHFLGYVTVPSGKSVVAATVQSSYSTLVGSLTAKVIETLAGGTSAGTDLIVGAFNLVSSFITIQSATLTYDSDQSHVLISLQLSVRVSLSSTLTKNLNFRLPNVLGRRRLFGSQRPLLKGWNASTEISAWNATTENAGEISGEISGANASLSPAAIRRHMSGERSAARRLNGVCPSDSGPSNSALNVAKLISELSNVVNTAQKMAAQLAPFDFSIGHTISSSAGYLPMNIGGSVRVYIATNGAPSLVLTVAAGLSGKFLDVSVSGSLTLVGSLSSRGVISSGSIAGTANYNANRFFPGQPAVSGSLTLSKSNVGSPFVGTLAITPGSTWGGVTLVAGSATFTAVPPQITNLNLAGNAAGIAQTVKQGIKDAFTTGWGTSVFAELLIKGVDALPFTVGQMQLDYSGGTFVAKLAVGFGTSGSGSADCSTAGFTCISLSGSLNSADDVKNAIKNMGSAILGQIPDFQWTLADYCLPGTSRGPSATSNAPNWNDVCVLQVGNKCIEVPGVGTLKMPTGISCDNFPGSLVTSCNCNCNLPSCNSPSCNCNAPSWTGPKCDGGYYDPSCDSGFWSGGGCGCNSAKCDTGSCSCSCNGPDFGCDVTKSEICLPSGPELGFGLKLAKVGTAFTVSYKGYLVLNGGGGITLPGMGKTGEFPGLDLEQGWTDLTIDINKASLNICDIFGDQTIEIPKPSDFVPSFDAIFPSNAPKLDINIADYVPANLRHGHFPNGPNVHGHAHGFGAHAHYPGVNVELAAGSTSFKPTSVIAGFAQAVGSVTNSWKIKDVPPFNTACSMLQFTDARRRLDEEAAAHEPEPEPRGWLERLERLAREEQNDAQKPTTEEPLSESALQGFVDEYVKQLSELSNSYKKELSTVVDEYKKNLLAEAERRAASGVATLRHNHVPARASSNRHVHDPSHVHTEDASPHQAQGPPKLPSTDPASTTASQAGG